MAYVTVTEVSCSPHDHQQLWGANLEAPVPGSQSRGDLLEISGWIVGRRSAARRIEAWIDGRVLAATSVDVSRPDVAAYLSEVPGSERSGFRFRIDIKGVEEFAIHVVLESGERFPLAIVRTRPRWGRTGTPDAAPLVSVVIPCYNLGAYLDEAVQSVLGQTYDELEIVIVDDGSSDEATRLLFASYQRPKTRVLRTANHGLAAARNLGIGEAKGKYVSCLDADDILDPDFLQLTVEALEADPAAAFASCWLTAFGESEFSWRPRTCDFPRLLAEDTVCTAALTRRNAILEIGGFDTRMPLPGYEDWDVAITLVERGWHGVIVPEYLFRYRTRAESMSTSCTSPDNHARLFQYLLRKHADTYRRHLPGVLASIEERTIELEEQTAPARMPGRSGGGAFGTAEKAAEQAETHASTQDPSVTVVVTCLNDSDALMATIESIQSQASIQPALVIVDRGASDASPRQLLDAYRGSNVQVLHTGNPGAVRARAAGIEHARTPFVVALDAGQTLASDYLRRAVDALESNSDAAFVSCGMRDESTGYTWKAQSLRLADVLACPRMAFPMVRTAVLTTIGGYDTAYSHLGQADWDLVIRLTALALPGILLSEPLITGSLQHWFNEGIVTPGQRNRASLISDVVDRHAAVFDACWADVLQGHEMQRRHLQAALEEPVIDLPPPVGGVDWGSLRRLEPVSRVWGIDRGQPIDRYYITQFLERNRRDIRGHVLEVKDHGYTHAYGQGVVVSDVVDIAPDNPAATLICDLTAAGSLPENAYDCFILTQTLHIIYDIHRVVANAARTLRPGGVLLATLPCVSRIDYESGVSGDCWRLTPAAAARLFQDAFGKDRVEVHGFGNVLVCCAFLLGLASHELTAAELRHRDPYFPLLVCVRAVKAR